MPLLRTIVNTNTSDASDINQYKALFQGGQVYDVLNGYGAKGDGKILLDGVMTAASTTLTSAGGSFNAGTDVGKIVWVAGAGLSPPTTTPTNAANSTAANANMPAGAYTFAFTFTQTGGGETTVSPTSTTITTTGPNPSVMITFGVIPAQATGVKIYCMTGPTSAQQGYTGVSQTSGTTVLVSQCNGTLVGAAISPLPNTALTLRTTIASVTNATTAVLALAAHTSVALLAVPTNSAFSSTLGGGTLLHSTPYYYRVSAIAYGGGETTASTETTTTTGAGADTYSVTVNWGAVSGAERYNIYGRSIGAELLIGTTTATSFVDDGSVAPTVALPAVNGAGAQFAYGTDDTAIIQSTANLASPSGTLLFPPAVYMVAGVLTMPAGASWVGGNRDDAILAMSQPGYTNMISAAVSAPNGLTLFQLNCTAIGAGGVAVYTNRATNCLIQDCNFLGSFNQPINVYYGDSSRIQGCFFSGVGGNPIQGAGESTATPGDCINCFHGNQVTIVNCSFRNCRQDACYFSGSRNSTFTGNTVVGCPDGVQVRSPSSNTAIVGNVFDIQGSSVVYSFGVIVQTNATDSTISNNVFRTTVGTGTPVGAVCVDNQCHRTTIGNNVVVGGTYAKGIYVLTLSGGGTESLDCVITGNTVSSPTGFGIHVGAAENGTVVSNNSVRGGGDSGMRIYADRCTISGNKVRGPTGYDGILVGGSYCTVSGNHVSDVVNRAGILMDTTATYCSVVGNVCYNNNTYGINDTGNNNTFEGNVFQSNVTAPMLIASATSVARGNKGWNPRGAITTPGFPVTTGTQTNTTNVDVLAHILNGTSTMTYTVTGVLGTVTSLVIPANAMVSVWIPANYVFSPTFGGGVPTWKWYGT